MGTIVILFFYFVTTLALPMFMWRRHRHAFSVLHVDPGAHGGSWTDPMNLVTAYNPRNAIKSDLTLDQLGWRVREIELDDWDGWRTSIGRFGTSRADPTLPITKRGCATSAAEAGSAASD